MPASQVSRLSSVTRKMKRVNKFLSAVLKAINYGRGEHQEELENEEPGGRGNGSRSRSRSDSNRRPPSAPTRKPPTIRIRRELSLNGMVWGSPQQMNTSDSANTTVEGAAPAAPARRSRKRHNSKATTATTTRNNSGDREVYEYFESSLQHPLDSGNHLKVDVSERVSRNNNRSLSRESGSRRSGGSGGGSPSPYRSSSKEHISNNNNNNNNNDYSPEAERFVRAAIDKTRPIERQVIRIINGNEPTVQSQVLLNTKTSQPWDDLVIDLGMAVKLQRQQNCHMETISGRRIQSYSQLRSELLVGNHAFYVYTTREDVPELGIPSVHKAAAAAAAATSVAERSSRSRRNSQAHSPVQLNHHQSQSSLQSQTTAQSHLGKPPSSIPTAISQRSASTNHLGSLNINNNNSNNESSNNNNNDKLTRKSSFKSTSTYSLGKTSAASHPRINNAAPDPSNVSSNLNNKYIHDNGHHLSTAGYEERSALMSSRSNPNLTSRPNNNANNNNNSREPPATQQSLHVNGGLGRKRSTRRRRSQNSVYLASVDRSRSVSP